MESEQERHNERIIGFMRRQCEATEKVVGAIKTLTFWVTLLLSSIAVSLIIMNGTG